ncbi:MAG: small ribosomal subunit Rsm22 family protein [Nibricoccus sp.]
MNWSELDWKILDRLRDGFLSGKAASGPYWQSSADLANYDFTYGERIGWKWDAVLHELQHRGWRPPAGLLVDWACGSGIAGRRVLSAFGGNSFDGLRVWDHSLLAREFAAEAARNQFAGLKVAQFAPGEPIGLLVVSHVLNELSAPARDELLDTILAARAVLWVEPGTHEVSRQLAALRDRLRHDFSIVAPCTHAANCPLFTAENARHWCHFFAPAPSGIYADSNWVRFGQQAGVDLRSLPYSFLVLERKEGGASGALVENACRVIGRPQVHKAHADLLACDKNGLHDVKLFKRTDPALHKQLDRKPPLPLYAHEQNAAGQTVLKPLYPG